MRKTWMKAFTLGICGTMLMTASLAMADAPASHGYIVFGADLSKNQCDQIMKDYFQVDKKVNDYEVSYCTNEEEHKAFDAYLSKKVIGSRAVSSILLIPQDKGDGIDIEMNNITYVTEEMYQNALISAGVEDVEVHIAAPFEVSGTCALLSAMNAYELMTGKELDAEAADTAVDELVTTGEIGDAIGDKEDAAELIATLKQELASNKENLSDQQLEKLIDKTAEDMDIQLDRELKQRLIDLLKRLQNINLDVDSLKQQAGVLYEKVSDFLDKANIQLDKSNIKLDPSNIKLEMDDIEIPEIDKEQTMTFLQRLIHAILNFLGIEK